MNTRVAAAKTLSNVIFNGQSLSSALPPACEQLSKPTDIPLLQEICYGSLRWYHRLDAIAQELLFKPLPPKEADVYSLLITGLYQLIYMRVPDYAAVSETVDAAKKLKKFWATGLLNKILRRFIKEKEALLDSTDKKLTYKEAHPEWLIQHLQDAWPEQYQNILKANNQPAPMFLRVNLNKTTRENYINLLKEAEIEGHVINHLDTAIRLEHAVPVNKLPEFDASFCSVQDASGQFCANALDLHSGQRVLDACAAPGSKTSHILEKEPELTLLTAIDQDAQRLTKVKDNIERLQLDHKVVHLVLADANHTKQWWEGHQYDRILVDAPCSGTGVIRRHPDIKLLRREEDINALSQQQLHLLNSLWPLLHSGGKLVYSTCSVLPQENERVISAFCKEHKDAKPQPLNLDIGLQQKYGTQFLPEALGLDGFYFCVINKP